MKLKYVFLLNLDTSLNLCLSLVGLIDKPVSKMNASARQPTFEQRQKLFDIAMEHLFLLCRN